MHYCMYGAFDITEITFVFWWETGDDLDEAEEKARTITQVLELQNTLDGRIFNDLFPD